MRSFLKVLLSFILFVSISLPFFAGQAEAASTYKSKVTADILNVRSKPGTKYSKVGTVKQNQVVTVYGQQKDWSNISYGKVKGWVATKYLSYVSWTGYVNATSLNVRKSASTTSSKLTTLPKGKSVKVQGQQGSWLKVYVSGSKPVTGWVSSSYISKTAVKASVPSSVTKTYYVTADSLNVRKSATTDSDVLFTLPLNTKVSVSETSGTWGKAKAPDGKTGWVSLKYLNTKPVAKPAQDDEDEPEQPPVESYLYLKQESNIRTGPSTDFDIVSVAMAGTAITKLGEQDGWYQIKTVDGIEGWVAAWLVTDSAPGTLKGKVIVLDAGHGGFDSGARGKFAYEKNIALSTAKEAEALLKKAGAKVIMTRSTDIYLTLSQRVSVSHKYRADAYISVHYNAGTSTSTGVMTFYYSKSKDYKLAQYLQADIAKQTGLKNQGVRFGDFHVTRENKQPAILLELGFISNPIEEKIIATKEYHKIAAKGIFDGLDRYFRDNR